MTKSKFHITSTLIYLLSVSFCFGPLASGSEEMPRLGVWVTVFSPEKVLDSKENTDKLIETSKRAGLTDIYMQIYRADKFYGEDGFGYLISEAKKNGLKVHAWINLLSISQNEEADIVKEYDESVITLDQHGRTSLQDAPKDTFDKYYIRENQLFLEPGDARVQEYLGALVEGIVKKFPDLSGVHFDYIRYPFVVPFVPGARFASHGISYGYTEANLEAFLEETGLDARTMANSRENFEKWDKWRRDNVTELLRELSGLIRSLSPSMEISCTIMPDVERTYFVSFQDWTRWLKENLADYVVAMNYTEDNSLMELRSRSLLMEDVRNKVYIGLGAHLLKDKFAIFKTEFESLRKLSPRGIVIFSYDDIAGNEKLKDFLSRQLSEGDSL